MKKRIMIICVGIMTTAVAFADTGLSSISDASDGVATYMPYVRGLCYVIAAIIAVVGALAVYYTMQTNPQNTGKRIALTGGSALAFVSLSIALPQFFGVDSDDVGGNSASGAGTSITESTGSSGFLSTDKGGISESGLITQVPNLADGDWVHFPNGTKMETAHYLLDIYDKNGGGSTGSYGKTLEYINNMYRNGEINYGTYNTLMSTSGSLPHN